MTEVSSASRTNLFLFLSCKERANMELKIEAKKKYFRCMNIDEATARSLEMKILTYFERFHATLRLSIHVIFKSSPVFHLSLNREGRWGITDDFTASFLHFSLFSTALLDLANSGPFHSPMLSSHLFLCLSCLV